DDHIDSLKQAMLLIESKLPATPECHAAGGEKIMAILEEIAVSASKQAETKTAILKTNGQHQNSQFLGYKTRTFGRYAGF
ncbi:hypothetical protein ACO1ZZ_26605, partial [Klebsiella quasipneumoniae]